VASQKREALGRLYRALLARDEGLLSEQELNRIELAVLEHPDVKTQNVRDVKDKFRSSRVKNT